MLEEEKSRASAGECRDAATSPAEPPLKPRAYPKGGPRKVWAVRCRPGRAAGPRERVRGRGGRGGWFSGVCLRRASAASCAQMYFSTLLSLCSSATWSARFERAVIKNRVVRTAFKPARFALVPGLSLNMGPLACPPFSEFAGRNLEIGPADLKGRVWSANPRSSSHRCGPSPAPPQRERPAGRVHCRGQPVAKFCPRVTAPPLLPRV